MIRFSLSCGNGHRFDGWFHNGADFDAQKDRGLISCPTCGSEEVEKALMTPAVATGGKKERLALAAGEEQQRLMARMQEMARRVRAESDYVGDKFAEEARKIHFGEADTRSIHGEATPGEARELAEDGVEFMLLPPLPEDEN